MLITNKPGMTTNGKFKVAVLKTGVWFAIDHQAFRLYVDNEGETRANAQARNRWYKRQLEVALKRLSEFGNKKTHGRQSRTTQKAKAKNAKQHRQGVRARAR